MFFFFCLEKDSKHLSSQNFFAKFIFQFVVCPYSVYGGLLMCRPGLSNGTSGLKVQCFSEPVLNKRESYTLLVLVDPCGIAPAGSGAKINGQWL